MFRRCQSVPLFAAVLTSGSIANQTGLRKRTDAIDSALPGLETLEQKLAFVTGTLGTR